MPFFICLSISPKVFINLCRNTLATFQLMKAIIQGCSISDIAI
jgi:hypothetical protein